jgi:ribosomal protein S18 acetylase RimI-like enzyme
MIREAKITDANDVAPLIVLAMGNLVEKFSQSSNPEDSIDLFKHFFQLSANQYSFENTLVFEDEFGKVIGSISAYDGADLNKLRKPFLNYITKKNNLQNFTIEDETQAGEFYLDTISVSPQAQGKGIGKQLIMQAIKWAKQKNHTKVGLLVDFDNPRAKKLYESLNFSIQNQVKFAGAEYYHMIYNTI